MITHDMLKSGGRVVQAVDPQQRVLFLDSSQLSEAHETRAGDTLNNSGEAAIVLQLASALMAAGLPASSLALVSPFTSQVGCYLLTCTCFLCMGMSCILCRYVRSCGSELCFQMLMCDVSPSNQATPNSFGHQDIYSSRITPSKCLKGLLGCRSRLDACASWTALQCLSLIKDQNESALNLLSSRSDAMPSVGSIGTLQLSTLFLHFGSFFSFLPPDRRAHLEIQEEWQSCGRYSELDIIRVASRLSQDTGAC